MRATVDAARVRARLAQRRVWMSADGPNGFIGEPFEVVRIAANGDPLEVETVSEQWRGSSFELAMNAALAIYAFKRALRAALPRFGRRFVAEPEKPWQDL